MAYNRYKKYNKNKQIGNLKPPFCEFNPHNYEAPVLRKEHMIIVSIDPGIVNCGIYVGCYDTIKKTHRSLYLSKLTFNGNDNHYVESIKKLQELEEKHALFSNSHYIVIESQMTVSYDNTRMCQHLITYFMTSMVDKGNRPIIVEITSQAKTRLLECPKGLSKYQYKKWCTNKALAYLGEGEEEEEKPYIDIIKKSNKKDDMGDAICQYYAWMKIFHGEAIQPTMPVKRF
jgi:hypothetical protein